MRSRVSRPEDGSGEAHVLLHKIHGGLNGSPGQAATFPTKPLHACRAGGVRVTVGLRVAGRGVVVIQVDVGDLPELAEGAGGCWENSQE